MTEPTAPPTTRPASPVRALVAALLWIGLPLGACAALTRWVFHPSWLTCVLLAPAVLAGILVWAWIQKYGSSGSYGTYQAIQKQLGRKP